LYSFNITAPRSASARPIPSGSAGACTYRPAYKFTQLASSPRASTSRLVSDALSADPSAAVLHVNALSRSRSTRNVTVPSFCAISKSSASAASSAARARREARGAAARPRRVADVDNVNVNVDDHDVVARAAADDDARAFDGANIARAIRTRVSRALCLARVA
jgi:hypothetical protein